MKNERRRYLAGHNEIITGEIVRHAIGGRSNEFAGQLRSAESSISMDGRSRVFDIIFAARL